MKTPRFLVKVGFLSSGELQTRQLAGVHTELLIGNQHQVLGSVSEGGFRETAEKQFKRLVLGNT